ncbi:polysaccharide pyruvyl transferase family protein [Providencia vermicola]|uniref:polysaccharide pyruvyl transferase family protein n=1 Tax=Providencia vermicola TaxID=333965 RepID=UPI0032DB32AC
MNILIMRASNSKNYGSLMMVANYVYYMQKNENNIKFIVDNVENDGLERIKEAANYNNITSFKELGIKLRPNCQNRNKIIKTMMYFNYSMKFGRMIKNLNVDRVIQLGGDDFSEYYSIKALFIEILKIVSLKNNKIDVTLIGQTMGPFSSWRIPLIKTLFRNIKIYTRDRTNYEYLKKELTLENVYESADLAYLPLPRQNDIEVKEQAVKLINHAENYIVIVPSGLWKAYTSNRDNYINAWIDICYRLRKMEFNIILLAHVLSDTSSDKPIIEEIYSKIISNSPSEREHIVAVTETIQPVVAREIISNSRVVISGRMHACVSALQTGTPTIPLSYSVKFKGVIGELPVKTNIIESASNALWESPFKISQLILNECNEIINSNDSKEKIAREIFKLESKIISQIN